MMFEIFLTAGLDGGADETFDWPLVSCQYLICLFITGHWNVLASYNSPLLSNFNLPNADYPAGLNRILVRVRVTNDLDFMDFISSTSVAVLSVPGLCGPVSPSSGSLDSYFTIACGSFDYNSASLTFNLMARNISSGRILARLMVLKPCDYGDGQKSYIF